MKEGKKPLITPDKKCYVVKIIVIGNQSVGKTNIINRYVKGEFTQDYNITIGMDFLSCNLELGDKIFKLRIWDTAGSEQFRSITKGYYQNSCCAIIVYDITDESSFRSVKQWIDDCHSYGSHRIHLVLVGNKIDLQSERKITKEDATELATQFGMEFIETSAKTGENINTLFEEICKYVNKNIDEGKYDLNDPSVGVGKSEYEEGMEISKSVDLNKHKLKGDLNNNQSKKKCCKG